MISQRTSVGLDVHARSVVAAAIDERTGEVIRRRFGYDPAGFLSWVGSLPRPAAVTYEAGPTGFALARLFEAAGITCLVAAPSKLQRPTGDRVKTDARDSLHLARLRLDEIVAVRVPSIEQETARDLVRAREDNRAELMAARHRLSKLLLRHGIIYDGKAWTGAHDAWLRRHRSEHPGLQAAFDADYEAVQQVGARKDRLDRLIEQMAASSEYSGVVRRLGCLRGISTLTAFALAVEIGDCDRFTGSTIARSSDWCRPSTPPGSLGCRARSPRPATPTPAGCSSKRPGSTANRIVLGRSCRPAGPKPPGSPSRARTPATIGCIESGNSSPPARSVP